MIINRHNYEEYFLLYVDNELSVAERQDVELFIEQNSDLAAELLMLQQATLQADEAVTFGSKSMLLKTGDGINKSNYEDYFLRHVDEELTAGEKQDVERFVLQHPQLQNEFTLLQQTKLQPEHIPFANKEALYRSTNRRVIPLYILRGAVAAVFIGVAVTLYLLTGSAGTEVNTGAPTALHNQPAVTQPQETNILPEYDKNSQQSSSIARHEEPTPQVKEVEKNNDASTVKATFAAVKKADKAEQVITPVQRSQAPEPVIIPEEKPDNQQELAVLTTRNLTPENRITKQAVNNKEDEAPVMQQAVYKELDTRQEETDNSILFGSTQINKKKLRSLFKKATRLFDKDGEKDPNEKPIQIASFELKGK